MGYKKSWIWPAPYHWALLLSKCVIAVEELKFSHKQKFIACCTQNKCEQFAHRKNVLLKYGLPNCQNVCIEIYLRSIFNQDAPWEIKFKRLISEKTPTTKPHAQHPKNKRPMRKNN